MNPSYIIVLIEKKVVSKFHPLEGVAQEMKSSMYGVTFPIELLYRKSQGKSTVK